MTDEIQELRSEIIALKEINGKMVIENGELKEENNKFKEEIEALKLMQKNSAESTIGIPTSHFERKISSNFALEEEPKCLTKRFVPNWLIEVLAWINRIEMANSKLSTSSELFKQLCWPKLHLNVKAHKIPSLQFSSARYELGDLLPLVRLNNQIVPIASIPPPNYIVGIRNIDLNFMDEKVVNFIKCIAHFLQNCTLYLYRISLIFPKMDIKQINLMRSLMECLIVSGKIFKLIFNGQSLHDINRLFPGMLDQVQNFKFWSSFRDFDFIMKWLLKNQPNYGKQKTIEIDRPSQEFMVNFINHIKEEFINSNSSSNFLIGFYLCLDFPNFEEFTLENKKTNEILISYSRSDENGYHYFFLARYPKEEEQWKKVGEDKIQQIKDFTYINIIV